MVPRDLPLNGRSLRIGPAKLSDILPLRQRILRVGLGIEEARFPGDENSTTLHAAVFDHDSVISCATLMLDAWEGGRPAWRLRGMATDSNRQSQGIGGALLDYLIDWAITDPPISQRIRIFWCNARVPALAFYQRLGWIVDSEEFDIPTAGPHRRMFRQL
jgi:GNAT superfamily N-acetyltransferase